MGEENKVRMRLLMDIKQAIQNDNYGHASRLAGDYVDWMYFLQSKNEVFLGEVLKSIYEQVEDEVESRTISKVDMAALNTLMVNDMSALIDGYARGAGMTDALIDLRYNATVFQHTVDIKYDYKLPHSL